MTNSEPHYKTLLIQIRQNPKIQAEEIDSFMRYGHIPEGQLDVWNVFDNPSFGPEILEGYHAIFVGGASEASVLEPETYPFVHNLIEVQRACIQQRIPCFASCFGFQTAVLALDGVMVKDTTDFEMGTIEIKLTSAALEDPLFRDAPNPFLAVSCHQEKTLSTPAGTTQLAFTNACCHSFKVNDAPFWAFQFHPELDRTCFVERLSAFRDHYTETDDHFERVARGFKETPESNLLVRAFIERILIPSLN